MNLEIGYLLADNSRQLRRLFNERMRALGVTGQQARLLLSLQKHPGQNQAFHAERLEVEPITLCRMIDRMEKAGLVSREADPNDRRARLLALSSVSKKQLSQIQAEVEDMMGEVLADFTDTERNALHTLVSRVSDNLAKMREPEVTANG